MSAVPLKRKEKRNAVYIAAPFFTIAERWMVRETRNALHDCGATVFSPLHDVDVKNNRSKLTDREIASLDLKGLEDSDVIFAVANGIDPGTLFEVGYGIAKGKRVIVLVENINPNDLTMLSGTGCEIVSDFATAVYKASW
jgi:nucleoside 2-deoxyribosyltransferase